MTGTLWSVTAIKSAGKLTKGMSVEILVTGTRRVRMQNRSSKRLKTSTV